ncbi:MAG: hypothetical protein ACOZFS_03990 [Thermodesulfobacteriota bacterium]
MADLARQGKLYSLLGILCFLLLSYPLMQIFNYDTFVTGLPLLFLYIFGVWVLAIIGLYAMSNRFASADAVSKQEAKINAQ